MHANRVVATSPAARAEGVARHQRRREAQGRCPALVVVEQDLARDARTFEPVVAVLDAITPRVEITRPGQVAFPTRGPSRYFGGDAELVTRTLAIVTDRGGRGRGGNGAGARRCGRRSVRGRRWPPAGASGRSWSRRGSRRRSWPTGPSPLSSAQRWSTCSAGSGCASLGDLAALPGPDVLARFGSDGQEAWRLAGGLDERPPATEPPPADLTVTAELDPPADTVEPAAFVARGMAEELHRRLWAKGSACTRVVIGAETEHGERLERVWRAEGALTAAAMADRLRWQLDGWLQGSARHRPTAGISRLWLVPDEVVPAGGRQLGFWGTDVATTDRATRAVARVQGLLGLGAVTVPEWRGGRDPATQVGARRRRGGRSNQRAAGCAPRPRRRARGPGGCPVRRRARAPRAAGRRARRRGRRGVAGERAAARCPPRPPGCRWRAARGRRS